ncbi:MAG: MBL fold metallo-hydrolase [Pseudomonadota bacterium]
MSYRATILGCGSSGGVPRLNGDWGACDPSEPKNARLRCSLLVERSGAGGGFERDGVTSLLVDTSPDMRRQMLNADVRRVDGVLYTHDHADQSHGIDELRVFALTMGARIPVLMDELTGATLIRRFDYCFKAPEGSLYPPILEARPMPTPGEAFEMTGPAGPIAATAFLQNHGPIDSLGFRFGGLAYSSDVVDLPEESFELLEGVDTWIVDALRYKPHRTHAHLDKALEWIDRVRPRRAVLTNLHIDMDYETLKGRLPGGVEPAFDGMQLAFEA